MLTIHHEKKDRLDADENLAHILLQLYYRERNHSITFGKPPYLPLSVASTEHQTHVFFVRHPQRVTQVRTDSVVVQDNRTFIDHQYSAYEALHQTYSQLVIEFMLKKDDKMKVVQTVLKPALEALQLYYMSNALPLNETICLYKSRCQMVLDRYVDVPTVQTTEDMTRWMYSQDRTRCNDLLVEIHDTIQIPITYSLQRLKMASCYVHLYVTEDETSLSLDFVFDLLRFMLQDMWTTQNDRQCLCVLSSASHRAYFQPYVRNASISFSMCAEVLRLYEAHLACTNEPVPQLNDRTFVVEFAKPMRQLPSIVPLT